MIRSGSAISIFQQWLSSKAEDLQRTVLTKTVHFDSVEAVALHSFSVGSRIRKLENSNSVEIKWFGKGLISKRLITNNGQEKVLQLGIKNIVKADVDAIICGANSSLDTTTGLAKTLSIAGGLSIQSQLKDYVKLCGKAAEGSSVAVKAGQLKCKWVVFAVIPKCFAASPFCSTERESFRAAVFSSLSQAAARKATTVAIPALTPASSQMTTKECAEITIQASRQYLESRSDSSVSKIEIVLPPDPELVEEFENEFSSDFFAVGKLQDMQPPKNSSLWLYQDDSGGFANYDEAAAKALEEKFQANISTAVIQIKKFTYEVDFDFMIQTNVATWKRRRIQRIANTDSCAWFYEESDGSYKSYDKISTLALERARVNGQRRVSIETNEYTYTIDLKKMEQTNNSTNTKRSVRKQSDLINTSCSFPKLAMSFPEVDVDVRGQSANVEDAVRQLTRQIKDAIRSNRVNIPDTLSASIQTFIKQYGEAYGVRVNFDRSFVATVEGFKHRADKFGQDLQVYVMYTINNDFT